MHLLVAVGEGGGLHLRREHEAVAWEHLYQALTIAAQDLDGLFLVSGLISASLNLSLISSGGSFSHLRLSLPDLGGLLLMLSWLLGPWGVRRRGPHLRSFVLEGLLEWLEEVVLLVHDLG